jgi:hypothetical protein
MEKTKAINALLYGFIAFLCLVYFVPFMLHTIVGSTMRLSGDDYCYSGVLKSYGFWNAQIDSYTSAPFFHGNRFALTLFSSITGLFDPLGNAILPGLVLFMWLLGLTLLLRKNLGFMGGNSRLVVWIALALSFFIIFFTLELTPDVTQSLYWRSGMIPYLIPLVMTLFIAHLIRSGMQKPPRFPRMMALFVLSWLTGGLSETSAVFLVAFLGIGLLLTFLLKERQEANRARLMIISALIGVLLALFMLMFSPVTSRILNKEQFNHDIWFVLSMTLENLKVFLARSLKYQWIILGSIFCLFVFSSLLFGFWKKTFPRIELSHLFLKFIIISGSFMILIFSVLFPSAYARNMYPENRTMIMAEFVLAVFVASIGWFSGEVIKNYLAQFRRTLAALVICLAMVVIGISVIPIRSANNLLIGLPRYQRWASFWDQRNSQIGIEKESGKVALEVMQLDHIIPDVGDLSPDPAYWYNVCASLYYEVSSISANQPGWDNK